MKTKPKNQREAVIAELKKGVELSPLNALMKFGTLRLGAHIHALRKRGMKIKSIDVKFKTLYGRNSQYTKYKLLKP